MGLVSLNFILLLGVTLGIYYSVPVILRRYVLLAASLVFYCSFGAAAVLFPLTASLLAWWLSLKIQNVLESYAVEADREDISREEKKHLRSECEKKCGLWSGAYAAAVILVLLLCKYICPVSGTKRIIIPLGISYFSLKLISYVCDVARGVIKAEKKPLNVVLFSVSFLTVMQGPFDRYSEFSSALDKGLTGRLESETALSSIIRILWGYVKKLCIADQFAVFANEVFNNYYEYSGGVVILGICCFCIQLYADFSGYMDIIIGTGGLFGLKIPENFKQPFFSQSVSEFWRRWHITLGKWLQDYLLYPLLRSEFFKKTGKCLEKIAGKKTGRKLTTYLGTLILWVIIGLWHGSGWTYVFGVGLLQFFYIVTGEITEGMRKGIRDTLNISSESKVYKVFAAARTTLMMLISWVFFRAPSLRDGFGVLYGVFRRDLPGTGNILWLFEKDVSLLYNRDPLRWLVFLAACFICLLVDDLLKEKGIAMNQKVVRGSYLKKLTAVLVLVFCIIIFGAYGSSYSSANFLYFEF